MILRWSAFSFVLVAACAATDAPEASTTSSDSPPESGSTAVGETTADEETTSADDSGGTTTAAVDTTTGIDPTVSTTMPTSDTDPPPLRLCSLEALDPSADPTAVIDAGDGEGQIPTVIGEVLLRSCGCHYTDDVPPGPLVDYQSNAQPMATHADFHGNFTGIFPMGFETMPAYVAVNERVVNMMPLPMPPFLCQVEGEMGTIAAADYELLADWLAASAPDGANFP